VTLREHIDAAAPTIARRDGNFALVVYEGLLLPAPKTYRYGPAYREAVLAEAFHLDERLGRGIAYLHPTDTFDRRAGVARACRRAIKEVRDTIGNPDIARYLRRVLLHDVLAQVDSDEVQRRLREESERREADNPYVNPHERAYEIFSAMLDRAFKPEER
jgi:hypothetical protein